MMLFTVIPLDDVLEGMEEAPGSNRGNEYRWGNVGVRARRKFSSQSCQSNKYRPKPLSKFFLSARIYSTLDIA